MSHHQLLNEAGQRLLLVRYLGKRKLLLREPDDVAAVLARPGEDAFRKHPRQQRVSAFLGAGELQVEMQDLLKRHSLDLLGLAALRTLASAASARVAADAARTAALAAAAAVEELAVAAKSAAGAARAAALAAAAAVEELIEAASLWLLMALPVPNELLPGYGTYEANVRRLDELVYDMLVTMLLGGTDTSALTVAFAAWHLAAEPQLQAELRREVLGVLGGRALGELRAEDVKAMPLLAAVVNETLRLHPPLAEITRVATQPNAFLPFGVGSRSCIGRHFGLLSTQLTLAALVARFEVLPPAPPAPTALDWSQSIVITSRSGVWLRLRPIRQ
eukprot:XP_001694216.1 cytochrome P450 [Chlamydomonas reinhardtii]